MSSHLLEPWHPWWLHADAALLSLRADGTALVQVAEEPPTDSRTDAPPAFAPPPPPARALPSVASLLPASRPSPALAFHAAECVCAYTLVLRLYNGDAGDDPSGAAALLLSLSHVLQAAAAAGRPTEGVQLPRSAEEALEGVTFRARQPGLGAAVQAHSVATAADASRLLGCGRGAVVCALEDLRRLFAAAAAAAQGGAADGLAGRPALLRTERKLHFLAAWANEVGKSSDVLPQLAATLQAAAVREQAARVTAHGGG